MKVSLDTFLHIDSATNVIKSSSPQKNRTILPAHLLSNTLKNFNLIKIADSFRIGNSNYLTGSEYPIANRETLFTNSSGDQTTLSIRGNRPNAKYFRKLLSRSV